MGVRECRGAGKLKAIIFDWGDTLMCDFREFQGPMVHWPHVELIPGVEEALEQLHERFICCAASNADDSDAELMGQALARVGIRQYFHYLFTSKELGASKPHPDFFRRILQRLEIKPAECVVVGNDYKKDIFPAKSIGMYTVWLTESTRVDAAPGADEMIDSMCDLPDAVEKLVFEEYSV